MYYNSDRNMIVAGAISHIRFDTDVFENIFFISGLEAASNEVMLKQRGIDAVFSVLDKDDEVPNFEGIMYRRFDLPDGEGDIVSVAKVVAEEIDHLKDKRILIHCAVGISRSVSVFIYYLMLKLDISYAKARKLIRRSRCIAAPVKHYRDQLLAWRDQAQNNSNGIFVETPSSRPDDLRQISAVGSPFE